MTRLDPPTLAHLVRAAAETSEVDGYPPSSAGDGSGRRGPADSSSTERAALSALSELPRADPLMETLISIFASLEAMGDHARLIEKRVPVVVFANSRLKGRVSTISQCQACHRDVACTVADRLRAGYCSSCYMAWTRQGRPDRVRFEHLRNRESA
jgi:hypothetical protein